jgi:Protein of unknown function (DUF1203)
MNNFQINALNYDTFAPLFHLDGVTLAAKGMVLVVADKKPSFPCRVSLKDADIGEDVLLLPYEHLSVVSPYRASGPIYVRKKAETARLQPNEIPYMLTHRLLSVRGYDRQGMMKQATVAEGKDLKAVIHEFFDDEAIDFLHIHNAKPGCFSCEVRRV